MLSIFLGGRQQFIQRYENHNAGDPGKLSQLLAKLQKDLDKVSLQLKKVESKLGNIIWIEH